MLINKEPKLIVSCVSGLVQLPDGRPERPPRGHLAPDVQLLAHCHHLCCIHLYCQGLGTQVRSSLLGDLFPPKNLIRHSTLYHPWELNANLTQFHFREHSIPHFT